MKYRKKQIVIEAWQYAPGLVRLPWWLLVELRDGSVWMQGGEDPHVTIKTLEGAMRADPGDWIIRGINGELSSCKPDIFAVLYEPVA